MRVVLLFTDGVGVGANDPATNPLARAPYLLSQFSDGSGTPLPPHGQRHDVDTTFGVKGRPQSASNQTALYTGLPAPSLIDGHVLGFPTQPLRALLEQHSIIRSLCAAAVSATFANAFPRPYLKFLELPHDADPRLETAELPPRLARRLKPSASTLAMAAAGVPFRTIDDAHRGLALTHDVDGSIAAPRVGAPRRTAAEAAALLWAFAADFTLFEHFLSDEAGHARDFEAAERSLSTFDRFAREVIERAPPDAQIIVCSDHGNVEDLSSRRHTTNPVAVLSFGPHRLRPLKTIADVGLAVLHLFGVAR